MQLLAKHGKKIQHVARQRSLKHRAAFIAEISYFPKEMLVWVDETGCDKIDMLRKFGYAFRGERAVCHRWLVRGRRVSAIGALSCEGILDVEVTTESVNGDKYCDFLRGSLIPNMLPYDGSSPKSVVVMDNCSIHHIHEVSELLEDAGILLI